MNRLSLSAVCGLAMLAGCSSPPPAGSNPEVRVFENFTLIDGTGKAPVPNAAIAIGDDGRILYVGDKAGAPSGPRMTKVDLTGKFIVPGIMNLHGHLGSVKGVTQDPKFYTEENLLKQLKTYAQYGVTSVVSMGSDAPLILDFRAKQRSGKSTTTRVFTALRGFTGIAGYPSTVPGMKGVPYEVDQIAEAEKDVDELASKKVDLVKIWVDDHLGKEKKISIDLCKAIIAQARKNNLNTAAHIFYHDDALKLSEAGLYAFAHSVRDKPVSDQLITTVKKNHTWQIPTLTREVSTFVYAKPHEFLKDAFFLKGADPDAVTGVQDQKFMDRQAKDPNLARYQEFLKTAQANLKKLADSGVKIGFGTDTGPPGRFSGFFEHWEMELMAEAGLTAGQIIESFSRNAAEFLGVSKDLGTLETNKWADLIVLGKNPMDDINNMRSIEQVMISGVPVQ